MHIYIYVEDERESKLPLIQGHKKKIIQIYATKSSITNKLPHSTENYESL